MKVFSAVIILIYTCLPQPGAAKSVTDEVQTIEYFCTVDSSYQKALYFLPGIDGPTPLLVALHPWSSDYTNSNYAHYADYCIENDWVFIHPNFRGKNNNPDATGSDKAIQDIVDAVAYALENSLIDTNRIYLAGASGGGHAALLTAGKFPGIWAGVSAWVPIIDLVQWYEETKSRRLHYWQDIYNSCGGDPTSDSAAHIEAWNRSPVNILHNARDVNIDLNAGINDGHSNYSVPVSHTLYAFNTLADSDDSLSNDDINYFVSNIAVPTHLSMEKEDDPLFAGRPVLFRRKSGNARVTIFDGGHEIIYYAACEWLSHQVKNTATGILNQGNVMIPQKFMLKQNYPNPFSAKGGNPGTTIKYLLPTVEATRRVASTSGMNELLPVKLVIYDMLGRKVATLVNEHQRPGDYQVSFDASSLSSGVYFYKLTAGNYISTKKMLLLR